MTEKEIEVGEYVRSKIGSIGKVTKIEEDKFLYENRTLITWVGNVIKHSKNIIDLIEVGDFVNGYKVLAIADSIYENSKRILIYRDTRKEKWIYIQEYDGKLHTQDDIVEILTHEQYQANCYTVERKE